MPCFRSIRCSTRRCWIGERRSSGIRNPWKRHPATYMLIEVGRWPTGREDAPEAYFEDVVHLPEADRHREIWRSLIVLDPKEDGRSVAWCGAHVEPSALCHSSAPIGSRLWLCPAFARLGLAENPFPASLASTGQYAGNFSAILPRGNGLLCAPSHRVPYPRGLVYYGFL
jgi:hypothetical protein